MRKILKNVSSTEDVVFRDIGRALAPNQQIEIAVRDYPEYLSSNDVLTAIRNGDVQVGDGWTFHTDPTFGEAYFRTRFGDDVYLIKGGSLSLFTPDMVTDPESGVTCVAPFMNQLTLMREFYNDPNSPIYNPSFTPLLEREDQHLERTLNLETIHNKAGWHGLEVQQALYTGPRNVLFYYGWLNSFNSATNSWNNENVAQDFAKYEIVVFGDGVQDPSHGDYANTQIIIPRLQALNPNVQIFGYVTANQAISSFETKAGQWNTLGVNGIFVDEAGYDFGITRAKQNEIISFIHNQSSANRVFINAWNIDHLLGTDNDVSYPNTTYNQNEAESLLVWEDWVLLESFGINTTDYSATNGYEPKAQWASRLVKAINKRYTYNINLASACILDNDSTSGQNLFDFAYVSALMASLDAFGTSDNNYGASTAAVKFWLRPNITDLGPLYTVTPAVQLDGGDSDVYMRFLKKGKLTLDFSDGAETYSVESYFQS